MQQARVTVCCNAADAVAKPSLRRLRRSLPEASGQCPVRKSGDKAANPLYDNIIRQL